MNIKIRNKTQNTFNHFLHQVLVFICFYALLLAKATFIPTFAVRSKRSLRTAHFDGVNAEPFMQIRMFCFPESKTGRGEI